VVGKTEISEVSVESGEDTDRSEMPGRASEVRRGPGHNPQNHQRKDQAKEGMSAKETENLP
jgi:hypothetical protein